MLFTVGDALGDYQIIGTIGPPENQLFQVEHRITKRKEALRVVLAELIFDGNIDRLTREVEVLARLNHPGIATVHNVVSLIDRLLLISEYVDGQSLAELISQGLPPEFGVDYICLALEALAYAHGERVVHGDVSSANIVVSRQGLVKLVNFGFAQSMQEVSGASSIEENTVLPYVPRKHPSGFDASDPRADLYSVGAVLAEIVIGRRLSDAREVPVALAELPFAGTKLRRELPAVILKALAEDSAVRFQSAHELLAALQHIKAPGEPAPGARRSFGPGRSVLVGALAVLTAAAGAVEFKTYREPAHPAPIVFAIPAPALTQPVLPPAAESDPPPAPPNARRKITQPAVQPSIAQEIRVLTPPAVPKKTPASDALSSTTTESTEAEPRIAPPQEPHANAAASEPATAEKKDRGIWSRLNRINPLHKKKKTEPAAQGLVPKQ